MPEPGMAGELAGHAAIRVAVVDDDAAMREALASLMAKSGHEAVCFADVQSFLDAEGPNADVVVTDLVMPGLTGLDLLERLRERGGENPVIVLTAYGDIPRAVQAIRAGAYDFVEKPFQPQRLQELIRRAAETRRLRRENARLRARLTQLSGIDDRLMGDCSAMRRVKADIVDFAAVDAPVMIVGETGVGKELAAQALHDFSSRAQGPFVPLNCSAIPDGLFESEMFGHVRGSFTGATQQREGHFAAANGGTLFLDEIASLDVAQQPKLLRVLQDGQITPIGSSRPNTVDVRVISATNVPVDELLSKEALREDLLYRLNVVTLHIPPLREREDDILLLFTHFLRALAHKYDIEPPDLTGGDITALLSHNWPGNVRELRNVAERFLLRSRRSSDGRFGSGVAETIARSSKTADAPEPVSMKAQVEAFEKQLIRRALQRNGGEVGAAAAELGIARRTLNEKMVRYQLTRSDQG